MTLRLTPDMLAAGYDFLRETEPFKAWKLPPAEEVGFAVLRTKRHFADFGVENGVPMIRVSEGRHGHIATLLGSIAHEMIHLHQWRKRLDRGGDHNQDFHRRAARVCAIQGFDPKTF